MIRILVVTFALSSSVATYAESPYDVDGNGTVSPLTDGLLILRHLFGFPGASLTDGALAPDCTRCSADDINAFISGNSPVVCTATVSSNLLTIGEQASLSAFCTGAPFFEWTADSGEAVASVQSPTISPLVDTTYTLTASNALGASMPVSITVMIIDPVPPPTAEFDCNRSNVATVNLQQDYDAPGAASDFASIGIDDAFTFTFNTGNPLDQVQRFEVAHLSLGTPAMELNISEFPCDFTDNNLYTVGIESLVMNFSVGVPQSSFGVLEPNSRYFINLRNLDATNNGAGPCPGNCVIRTRFLNTQ